jgi:thiamine biosynthesis lipoprotein
MPIILMKKYLLLLIFLLPSCSDENLDNIAILSGKTMGTIYQIKYLPADSSANFIDKNLVQTKIDSILMKINRQMSTYSKESEISRFNLQNSTAWFNVSADFALVVRQAIAISEFSNGAFDATIGKITNIWQKNSLNANIPFPKDSIIKSMLKDVNFRDLSVKYFPPSIKKENPNIYLDLSSIAKGYAVDKISVYLESIKIENYSIEIGGEYRVKGKDNNNKNWLVEIPSSKKGEYEKLSVENKSIATSGGKVKLESNRKVKFSSVINPKTGKPINNSVFSVTILTTSCMMANGFATAIHVLGEEKGMELAENLNLAVMMLVEKDNLLEIKMNDKFQKIKNGEK